MKHLKLFEAYFNEDIKSCFQALVDEYGFEYDTILWNNSQFVKCSDVEYDKDLLEKMTNEMSICLRKLQTFGPSKISLRIDFKYNVYKDIAVPVDGYDMEWIDGNEETMRLENDFTDLYNKICNKILKVVHEHDFIYDLNNKDETEYKSKITLSIEIICVN